MRITPHKLSFARSRRSRIKVKEFGLREFHEKRNKILIRRGTGGLGDILMHRMMFEDFKRVMPDAEIHFACPKSYHPAVEDHPYVDKILDSELITESDYVVSYDTSVACGRYEHKLAPFSGLNRSDIWANHCGVILTNHNMHLNISEEAKRVGEEEIKKCRIECNMPDKPSVCFCPLSASAGKNLDEEKTIKVVKGMKELGLMPFTLHHSHLVWNIPCPQLLGFSTPEWMGVINASDYVVSVDTAGVHCAGGLKKPVVGIFTWADGKAYMEHYPKSVLVQKHRDNGDWDCGPCYNWSKCAKCPDGKIQVKPCLTELTTEMIMDGIKKMLEWFPI